MFERFRYASVLVAIVFISGAAIAADDKVIHGTAGKAYDFIAGPVGYTNDGVVGNDSLIQPNSLVYFPLVRDNTSAELTGMNIRVYETRAGDPARQILCQLCTSDGTTNHCTTPAGVSSNGLHLVQPNMNTVVADSNQAYVVYCRVGSGSRIRSIKYAEP